MTKVMELFDWEEESFDPLKINGQGRREPPRTSFGDSMNEFVDGIEARSKTAESRKRLDQIFRR